MNSKQIQITTDIYTYFIYVTSSLKLHYIRKTIIKPKYLQNARLIQKLKQKYLHASHVQATCFSYVIMFINV